MDTVQRLESAWNAHSAGEFEPALQEYIALFDATGKDPETASLRLSYVLAAWARLAEEYVPARRALVEVGDEQRADEGWAIVGRLQQAGYAHPDFVALFPAIPSRRIIPGIPFGPAPVCTLGKRRGSVSGSRCWSANAIAGSCPVT